MADIEKERFMINILCFGDSNTNGSNPSGGRWGRWERWTGVLQKLLGDDYYVIEEFGEDSEILDMYNGSIVS